MTSPRGLIVLNKPRGPSSYDLVRAVKKKLHTRKVGHLGTLDPAAQGILIILVGTAARLNQYLHEDFKEYRFELTLGRQTTTLDSEGDVEFSSPIPKLSLQKIENCLASFLGVIHQRAPLYSAVKYQGKPLYEYARQGKTSEVPLSILERQVEIKELELLQHHADKLEIRTLCSKGTYIRSLCRDIGLRLGTHGYATKIERSRCAGFDLDQCTDYEEFATCEDPMSYLIPISKINTLSFFPVTSSEQEEKLMHGQSVSLPAESTDFLDSSLNKESFIVLKRGENAFGIGQLQPQDSGWILKLKRGL